MATVDLNPLVYGKIEGRFLAAVGDTNADVDLYPDGVPMVGTVTFSPNAGYVRVATLIPAPAIVAPMPIVCTLDSEGYLSYNGSRGVWLVATDSPYTNPTNFTYSVSFNVVSPTGVSVNIGSFSIPIPSGSTQNLFTLVPVSSSAGTITLTGPPGPVGPRGPAGPSGNASAGVDPDGTPVLIYNT